ncbi:spheroidene monooxygenase [Ilyomonas limi]|uniref:Spheroidene monooxygenase n=1 Tax=Ilyomonas limi TaxID=2575867 RepID=A0A4U3L8J3_9BACT|nr:spheroidene monooxygenase [Ilyomonas limi]TKK70829.1 spheroidene monooxygenase [Ilyomonas limi]
MYCIITIARYKKSTAFFGFLSMAFFRIFLLKNKTIPFYKLMGCGKNGTFDIRPDVQQWAVLITTNELFTNYQSLYGRFIAAWWKRFHCELFTVVLQPTEGHGLWDGKMPFGNLPKQTSEDGITAVLTRATIRPSRLKAFWQNVSTAGAHLQEAEGFIMSVGIGEVPWIKQATFSIWQNKQLMKQYAYGTMQHATVIAKTRKEKWYSEELFVRFKVVQTTGTINGINPLKEYLS